MIDAQVRIDFDESTKPMDPQRWIRPVDYPSDAAKKRQQGDVVAAFEIAANGAVANCMVTKSSGHQSLDALACRFLGRKARFQPARGSDGSAIGSRGEMTIRFRIAG